jgi:protein-S-isoprenylcysteine O-methyltransferase Ste14
VKRRTVRRWEKEEAQAGWFAGITLIVLVAVGSGAVWWSDTHPVAAQRVGVVLIVLLGLALLYALGFGLWDSFRKAFLDEVE